ncbi:MAG: leucine-rich repeat domain-containing protein [Clostridia bacterium]|nr:leucine-rich repeat domain-containing protein [Clostridia bacterium]
MRRFKRGLLALIAAIALLLCGVWAAAEDVSELTDVVETNGGTLVYTITDGIAAITGFQGEPTDVTIPAAVAGCPVRAIAEKAFSECDSLTSVTVPDGVKLIGGSAFYACRALRRVTLPDTVGVISPYAFYYCDSLESITLPQGLTKISNYTFYACLKLRELSVPDSVTSLGDYALYACKSLTSLRLPGGLTAIGHYALYDCVGLTELILPDALQTIGDYAFYNCTGLSSFTLPKSVTAFGAGALLACDGIQAISVALENTAFSARDGVLFSADGATLVLYPEGRAGTRYAVPDGVTAIASEAFSRCSALTGMTLPGGLLTLGDYAFSECTGLTSMTLPDGVQTIGNDAFYGCTGLTAVSLPDSVTAIGEEAFCDCPSLTSLTLPARLTEIGTYAFSGCSALTAMRLPATVQTVGDGAFLGCRSLPAISVDAGNTAFTAQDGVLLSADGATLHAYPAGKADTSYAVPALVKIIAPFAMAGVTALQGIRLPEGLTEIGERAFGYDSHLKAITLPASLTAVGAGAFAWCDALTAIEVADGNPNFVSVDGVLYSADQSILYAYPAGKPAADCTVADTVDSIETAAFAGAAHLQSVTLQNAASDIGADAFEGCADGFVLYGVPGSTAHMYAQKYGLTFAPIGTTPTSRTTATRASSIHPSQTAARPAPWLLGGVLIAVLLVAAVAVIVLARRRMR